MVKILFNEDNFGYGFEIFIFNVIFCGVVVVKIKNGFIGFYFFLIIIREQIVVVMNYVVKMFFFVVGLVEVMVFFVDKNVFGMDNVNIVRDFFKVVFKVDFKVVVKLVDVMVYLVDLWFYVFVDIKGISFWLGVWKYMNVKLVIQ